MIETDPNSIEGNWRFADDEAPDIGTVFTLEGGRVLLDDEQVSTYSIDGAVLTFTTVEERPEGGSLTTVYTLDLPGPLADPSSPTLLGSDVVRPDVLRGRFEATDAAGFGEDEVFADGCIFIRVA